MHDGAIPTARVSCDRSRRFACRPGRYRLTGLTQDDEGVELTFRDVDIVAATTARIDLSAYGFAAPLDMVRPKLDLAIRGRLILAHQGAESTTLRTSN